MKITLVTDSHEHAVPLGIARNILDRPVGIVGKIDENEIVSFKEEKEILIPLYNYLPVLERIREEMKE